MLEVSLNNRVFFDSTNAGYSKFLESEDVFGDRAEAIVYVECVDKCFSAEFLAQLKLFTEDLSRVESVSSAVSFATFSVPYEDGQGAIQGGLFADLDCSESSRCFGAFAASESVFDRLYVSSEKDALSVRLSIALAEGNSSQILELTDLLRRKSAGFEELSGMRVYLTGSVPMMRAFYDAASADLGTLLPVCFCVMVLLLFLGLGGLKPALSILVHSSFGVLVVLGLIGWLGIPLNTATSMLPLVILTISVATNMHFYTESVMRALSEPGLGSFQVAESAYAVTVRPITLAGLTTVIGLLSLLFVESPPLREVGIWSAVGIGSNLFFFFMFSRPLMQRSLPVGAWAWSLKLRQLMNDYARRLEANRFGPIGFAVVFLVLGFGLPRIEVDEDFVQYFSKDSSFRQGAERVAEDMHSPYAVQVVFEAKDGGSVLGADGRALVSDLVAALNEEPLVVRTLNIYEQLDWLEERLGLSGEESTPDGEDYFEQLLLTYEFGVHDVRQIDSLLSRDRSNGQIVALLADSTMAEIRQLVQRIEAVGDHLVSSQYPRFSVHVTGEGVLTSRLAFDSIRELGLGLIVTLLFLAGIVASYFRSAAAAIIVLIGCILSVVLGLSLWALSFGAAGLALVLVVAATIGVVIDDVIHFLYRFDDALNRQGLGRGSAAAYAVHRAGPAVLLSSLVLALGFACLGLSGFAMNREFGFGAVFVVLAALIVSLYLAPRALAARFGPRVTE
jgi:predicted RND superfamily exporter protein